MEEANFSTSLSKTDCLAPCVLLIVRYYTLAGYLFGTHGGSSRAGIGVTSASILIPEKDYGARVEKTKGTTSLASGSVLVTGEIPRVTTFEKGLAPNTQYLKLDGEFRHEPLILDDQALVVSVKDKGLVVITGCGHAGIVNTTDYARQISGVDRVHALIGGLHLEGQYFDPIIDQTVDSLEKISPKFIVPAHCTGLRASFKIFGAMPQNYVESGVGTTFKF